MKQVASLRYGVIFKKAFADPQIFTAFVRAIVGVEIEIDKVETEKSFDPPIGNVAIEFDLYAEDKKNRIIVDIQHERYFDHYDRFLHYQCAAILEQISNANDYRPKLSVYTVVVLTSGDKHKHDVAIIDFDPRTRQNEALGEIPHKIFYICPKYVNDQTPAAIREWLLAIDDSLDEEVNQDEYTHPEIQRIFDLIEKNLVTPEERASMFEESHQEELKQSSFAEGRETGREEGELRKAIEIARLLLADGMALSAVSRVTGLALDEVQALIAA